MKNVKVIFMAAEAAAIICLALFIIHLCEQGTIESIEGLFAFMLAMTAIVFQKEQQSISWEEDDDEITLGAVEDVEL